MSKNHTIKPGDIVAFNFAKFYKDDKQSTSWTYTTFKGPLYVLSIDRSTAYFSNGASSHTDWIIEHSIYNSKLFQALIDDEFCAPEEPSLSKGNSL